MSLLFWFLLLFLFELIQQAAPVNFMFIKHFQNLENLILNILKEKLHLSCLVSFWNSTVQTVMISKAMIQF